MTKRRVLQVANGVMFLVFVSWALFQYNDADFLAWATVYSLGALCCLLFTMDRLSPSFGALLVAGCLIWASFLLYFVLTAEESFTFTDDNIGEMLREAIGLFAVAGWTAFISSIVWKRKRARKKTSRTILKTSE